MKKVFSGRRKQAAKSHRNLIAYSIAGFLYCPLQDRHHVVSHSADAASHKTVVTDEIPADMICRDAIYFFSSLI